MLPGDRSKTILAEGETRFQRIGGKGGDYLPDHVVLVGSKLTEPVCRIYGWSPFHIFREDVVAALTQVDFTSLEFEEVQIS